MIDWMLLLLAALALASAAFCAQAARARLRPRRAAALAAQAVAGLLLLWAAAAYLQGARRVAEVLPLVQDAHARINLAVEARSELAERVAIPVVLAMPALVFGIGFLGPKRRAPEG